MGPLSSQVIVSCEHASNRLPEGFALDPALLQLHIAYDPGARTIARRLARRFDAPRFEGELSRLVVDLNRSLGNRVLMRAISDGHPIPFNRGLSESDRRERIERYYLPYRRAVEEAARAAIARAGRCVHLCVHTFTAALAGRVRGNDIGLLHDPAWGIEREVCDDVRRWLATHSDHVVWFNRPYSGTADGIVPALRRQHTPDVFVGLELEVNQRHAADPPALRRIADHVAEALEHSAALARPR